MRHRNHAVRMTGRVVGALLAAMLISITAIAAGPIASSDFAGAENPLAENGAWAALTSLSPAGGRFQKNKDRKSTRLNSSHRCISYAVFCLKKKNKVAI